MRSGARVRALAHPLPTREPPALGAPVAGYWVDTTPAMRYNRDASRGRAVVSSSGSIREVEEMDTKLKGDIAEQAVVLYALKRGWGVLRPVGDRLPYDLVLDIDG